MTIMEFLEKVSRLSLAEIQVVRSFAEELVLPFLRPFLSLEWFQSFASYPILEGQRGAISIVNSFFLGLLNSFFFSFPFSVCHLFVCQKLFLGERGGRGPAKMAVVGLVLGKWSFFSAVLLGFRSVVVPYLSLEPANLLLFVGLLTSCFLKTVLGKEENRGSFKIGPFAFALALAWSEEGCAFRYLGNVHLGPSSLLFLSKGSLFKDQLYLFGLLLGTLFFTSLFFYSLLFIKSRVFDCLVTLSFPRYYGKVSRCFSDLGGFFFVSYVALFSFFVPFYGPAYLLTTPLGFENSHVLKVNRRPSYFKKETTKERFRGNGYKSSKRVSQVWRGAGSFNSRNYTSLSTLERKNLNPTMSSANIYKKCVERTRLIYTYRGDKEKFFKFLRKYIPLLKKKKNRKQVYIEKGGKLHRAEKRKRKKEEVKGFLTGNEQRKEKREKRVEGEMWHTRGKRVVNRLKDKEGAGKTEKYRSRGQNRSFFLVDDKKRVNFLSRVEKSVGRDTKTNPRKGMRNQRDTGESKKTKLVLSLRGGFSPKKPNKIKIFYKKYKRKIFFFVVGTAISFGLLYLIPIEPEEKPQTQEENKTSVQSDSLVDSKDTEEKERIIKKCNQSYLKRGRYLYEESGKDREKRAANEEIIKNRYGYENRKITKDYLGDDKAQILNREIQMLTERIDGYPQLLERETLQIGKDPNCLSNCLSRDEIEKWKIKVKKITESREEPLILYIAKKSTLSESEILIEEKEEIIKKCNQYFLQQKKSFYKCL